MKRYPSFLLPKTLQNNKFFIIFYKIIVFSDKRWLIMVECG